MAHSRLYRLQRGARARAVYREFARILRTDAAVRGNSHRRRVLKVPQFAEGCPALLARFPDALVVRTGRDPDEVAASAASVVANQVAIQSNTADLGWIEAECRREIGLREARMDEALSGFAGPLAEVGYAQLGGDWRGSTPRSAAACPIKRRMPCAGSGTGQIRAPHAHPAPAYRAFARA